MVLLTVQLTMKEVSGLDTFMTIAAEGPVYASATHGTDGISGQTYRILPDLENLGLSLAPVAKRPVRGG